MAFAYVCAKGMEAGKLLAANVAAARYAQNLGYLSELSFLLGFLILIEQHIIHEAS